MSPDVTRSTGAVDKNSKSAKPSKSSPLMQSRRGHKRSKSDGAIHKVETSAEAKFVLNYCTYIHLYVIVCFQNRLVLGSYMLVHVGTVNTLLLI